MSEFPTSTALGQQMREKEIRLQDILTTVDELIARNIAEGVPPDSRHFIASATYREAHDNDRMGVLSLTRQSYLDPSSFLEITYNEHGFSDERNETDTTYVFTRTNDGDTLVQVSDAISADAFNAAITEAAEFGTQVEDSTSDPEMLRQAWDDLETGVHETTEQEGHEAALSLKPATDDDLARLEEIIAIAKDRTDWDLIDREHEAVIGYSPDRSSLLGRLASRAASLFKPRG